MIAKPAPVGGQIPDFVGTPVVGGAIYSASDDLVVFGDLDGNIYALDADTGAEVWVRTSWTLMDSAAWWATRSYARAKTW